MADLLEFEKEMFLDLYDSDILLVTARGLDIDNILLHFLMAFADPGILIFIINLDKETEKYIINKLNDAPCICKSIDSQCGASERKNLYFNGGIFLITARILIVDLLCNRVPIEHITGIVIHKAHKVTRSIQEAFICRLFREKNSNGFIKALSSSPESFIRRFGNLEKSLSNLFVGKISIWPRFHASVISSLDKKIPKIREIELKMSHLMQKCHSALLDLARACLKELKSVFPANKSTPFNLEIDDLVVPNFEGLLNYLLDCLSPTLSDRTRLIISNLKDFLTLLGKLLSSDSMTFLKMAEDLRQSSLETSVGWIFLDAADLFYKSARARVPGEGKIEPNGRWDSFLAILGEIIAENKAESLNIFVITSSIKNRDSLAHILQEGIASYLKNLHLLIYGKLLDFNYEVNNNFEEIKKYYGDPFVITDEDDWASTLRMVEGSKLSDSPVKVYIQCVYSNGGYSRQLHDTLKSINPGHIILYEPKYSLVRQLEVYQCRIDSPLWVYFLMYVNSFEEQLYLTGLSKERDAFEQIAMLRSSIVPLDSDPTRVEMETDERRGGIVHKSTIFVDMREFRSNLPYNLYMAGFCVLPITLEIGDYLLCPGLCVERKNVADLISSLHSGRLYTQCVAMCSVYPNPVILVEFDLDRAFTLQSKSQFSSDIVQQDLSSKLGLLSITFPCLRFLWCSNPQAGASLLTELKKQRTDFTEEEIEQNRIKVVQESESRSSVIQRELLLKITGVTQVNVNNLMSDFTNLADIFCASAELLRKVMSNAKAASDIYSFCHFTK